MAGAVVSSSSKKQLKSLSEGRAGASRGLGELVLTGFAAGLAADDCSVAGLSTEDLRDGGFAAVTRGGALAGDFGTHSVGGAAAIGGMLTSP